MNEFELSTNVISRVIEELDKAEKFIRIAMFQIHNENVFNSILKRLDDSVEVEIFTLPYDSIKSNIQTEVIQSFKNIEKKGAKLHFCKWNIGDPGRTTTASRRWYSFHGKFIVTEKCAISLSANFTKNEELDAVLIYRENEKIEEFCNAFNELIQMFTVKDGDREGKIYKTITNSPEYEDERGDSSIFKVPSEDIKEDYENNWIRDYPSFFCPINVKISDKLYIIPFHARGRDILTDLIKEADKFIYISTESFTDEDFPIFLCGESYRKNIDIKVLSGITSQDFQTKLNNTFKKLLASGVRVRYINSDLHAKLIITDKRLVVSSINLNKINLGFSKNSKYWRENTETLTVCTDKELIKTAKEQYLGIFQNSIDVRSKLEEKEESEIKKAIKLFSNLSSNEKINVKSSKKAKQMISKYILEKQIEVEKDIFSIGKIANIVMKCYNKKIIDEDIIIYTLILHFLLEKDLTFTQLDQNLRSLKITNNLNSLLSDLLSKNLVEIEENVYKINRSELLSYGGKTDGVQN